MFWKPAKSLGLAVGLVILLSIAAISAFLLQSALSQEPSMSAFVTGVFFLLSLPLMVLWGRSYYGLLTLRYYMDRNVLIILHGAMRYIIPLETIERIVPGSELSVTEGFRGVGWPGYLTGVVQAGLGRVLVNSTEPLERQLVVVTPEGNYGLSPRNPERFLDEFAAHRSQSPARRVPQRALCLPFAALPVWRDRRFWLTLGAALVMNVALFGLISGRYAYLPERFPMYLNPQREAYRIISRAEIYRLPAIGTVLLIMNGVIGGFLHRRERLAAYLLAAMSVVLQGPLWVAIFGVLSR